MNALRHTEVVLAVSTKREEYEHMTLRILVMAMLVAICPACGKSGSEEASKGSGGDSIRGTVETMVQYDTLRTGRIV